MLQAVALARKGKGQTAPNPCVGALLVCGDTVVAEGYHRRYGGPHAEVEALRDAAGKGLDPRSCTLYVTLEPCNHHGKTPPCTEALLAAGIRHVVVGARDPHPGVTGGGIERLRDSGVAVTTGVAEQACLDLIGDFVVWKTSSRPHLRLKLASTLDGRIATRSGHSAWISGEASRREVQRLRGMAQAVLVGGETFRQDNPRLTYRPPSGTPQPLAVVVTSQLPGDPAAWNLTSRRPGETIFWTTADQARSPRAEDLQNLGCRIWALPEHGHGLDLSVGLERLRTELGVLDVLCEGGGRLALSLVEKGLADELYLFLAPRILGDEQARPLFAGRSIETMDQALSWRIVQQERFDEDLLLVLKMNPKP